MSSVTVFALVLLFVSAGEVHSQALPRIGDEIDAAEIRYFGLFPDADDPLSATVRQGESGLEISVRLQDGVEEYALSTCEAEVFARCLDVYEAMAMAGDAMEILGRELKDPALQRCFASFMQKRVFVFARGRERIGRLQRLVLRDGTRIEGIPIALSDSHLVLWTAPGDYDHRKSDTAITVAAIADIDSVRGTFYVNSASHGWLAGLFSTGLCLYWISEEQRNVYQGPGGSGTTVLEFPIALILSGAASAIPALVTASVAGDEVGARAVTAASSSDVREELLESLMFAEPPPEVRRILASANALSSEVSKIRPDAAGSTGESRPVPIISDLDIGITFLMNLYNVRARPFGVLPALVLGKEIALLKNEEQPFLSLLPRVSYGPLHASAGINLLLHVGAEGELHAGIDHVWSRDELGRYRLELTDGGGRTERAYFVEGNGWSNAFATAGFGFRLAGFRVLLETRIGLAPAIITHKSTQGEYNPGSRPPDVVSGPNSYSGIGMSISWPLSF